MAINTISRGSYSRGKEVAEELAKRLGYECVSRDILLEASTEFNIPEIRLVKALHDAPSVLERFNHDAKDRAAALILPSPVFQQCCRTEFRLLLQQLHDGEQQGHARHLAVG